MQAALLVLMSGGTHRQAADAAKKSVKTIGRWLNEPEFRDELRRLQRERYHHAIGQTQQIAPVAVGVLAKVMTDQATPPSVKVNAADKILGHAGNGYREEVIVQRLDQLEEKIEITHPGREKGK
jgi:hypothetical protein